MAVSKSRDLVLVAEIYAEPVKLLAEGCYMILSFLSFFFLSQTVLRYSAPVATKQSGLLVNL